MREHKSKTLCLVGETPARTTTINVEDRDGCPITVMNWFGRTEEDMLEAYAKIMSREFGFSLDSVVIPPGWGRDEFIRHILEGDVDPLKMQVGAIRSVVVDTPDGLDGPRTRLNWFGPVEEARTIMWEMCNHEDKHGSVYLEGDGTYSGWSCCPPWDRLSELESKVFGTFEEAAAAVERHYAGQKQPWDSENENT